LKGTSVNFPFRGHRDMHQAANNQAAALEAQLVQERAQAARLLESEARIAEYTALLLGTKHSGTVALDSLRLTLHRKPVLGGVMNYAEGDEPRRTVYDITSDSSLEIVTYASPRERLRFRFARAPEGLYLDSNGNLLPLQSQEAQEGLAAAETICQRLGDLCVSRAA
jgi:hypothetical protein